MAYVNGHPMLMEFVGVAGSGKTTLREMLNKMDPQINKVSPPGKAAYLLPFLKIMFRWFPHYIRHFLGPRWFSWQEIRIMCYLESWLPYLRRCAVERDMIVVLDPGSIYWLTALKWLGPKITESPRFLQWWEEMRIKWMGAIDYMVWLDAPTDLLMERVMNRNEWHESMKLAPEEAARRFDLYRQGYSELVKQYSSKRKHHFLMFHTDKVPAEDIFRQVITTFDLDTDERIS